MLRSVRRCGYHKQWILGKVFLQDVSVIVYVCVYANLHCMQICMHVCICVCTTYIHVPEEGPYRNDKVVTRLWSPCNLVTTLLQPCHNLATTLSQPCDNLVTTL